MARGKRSSAATTEPATEVVLVEWLADSDDPGARHVAGALRAGGNRYSGRAGEQAQVPAADAAVLEEAGFVKVLGAVATVAVEWLRSTGDAASEASCNIGDRHYQGRAGERVEMREDDAQLLAASGYVKRVAVEA